MRNWWSGATLGMRGGAGGLALFVSCGIVACGGSSKSRGEPPSGDAGRGGSGAAGSGAGGKGTGGAGGGGSSSGGAGAGGATGGAGVAAGGTESGAAGVGGEPIAGSSGESSGAAGGTESAGGAAGDDASHAGESSGGAGGTCQNWCSEETPACCGDALGCVESAPSCRIDVFAESVDTHYEYADLVEAIGALSGALAATIPLETVEHAAAEAPPAARIELTLSAHASAEFADLAGMFRHPFRVSCDEQELFVGVLYMLGGAAALRTPVLHVEESESGALVLRIGAWQGAWLISGSASDPALSERIDRAELRAEFCARGVLGELP